jgi:hypothetical protein
LRRLTGDHFPFKSSSNPLSGTQLEGKMIGSETSTYYLIAPLLPELRTKKEDAIFIQQYHRNGPKWVELGRLSNGRSPNNARYIWYVIRHGRLDVKK